MYYCQMSKQWTILQASFKLFQRFGFDSAFARADVMQVAGITATPATELMRKMKEAKLIESAKGRGKYKFIEPID